MLNKFSLINYYELAWYTEHIVDPDQLAQKSADLDLHCFQ